MNQLNHKKRRMRMIQCKRVFLHINVLTVPLLAQPTIRVG